MDREALLQMVQRLGVEFARRGMRSHVAPLRIYWLALKHGLVEEEQHGLHLALSEETVVEWFKLLRLPGLPGGSPVRPTGSSFPPCPSARGKGAPGDE
jgi:hypothetical protein